MSKNEGKRDGRERYSQSEGREIRVGKGVAEAEAESEGTTSV